MDFYIASHKLAIELDGSQHYEDESMKYDEERKEYLKRKGITTLRYTNVDIQRNFQAVCNDILNHINMPSPKGEGGCEATG